MVYAYDFHTTTTTTTNLQRNCAPSAGHIPYFLTGAGMMYRVLREEQKAEAEGIARYDQVGPGYVASRGPKRSRSKSMNRRTHGLTLMPWRMHSSLRWLKSTWACLLDNRHSTWITTTFLLQLSYSRKAGKSYHGYAFGWLKNE